MKHVYSLLLVWLMVTMAQGQDVYYEPGRVLIPGTYEFQLQDGTRLRGQLVRNDSATFLIRTRQEGDRKIAARTVVRADLIGGTFSNMPAYNNGFPFRLLFMPTALPLQKRRLYYQNSYFVMSRLDVGLTRHWSVGAAFHNLRPADFHTFATKFGMKVSPRMHLGVSAQYIGMRVTEAVLADFTLVQGLVTVGTDRRNITVGLGATATRKGLGSSGVVTIGYVRKIAPDLTFISQNTILIGESIDPHYVSLSGIATAGLRFDRRRHAFDLAALVPVYTQHSLLRPTLLPYGSYQIRIGK